MKKTTRRIALAFSIFMCLQPVMYAVDAELNKEIVALELELTKMKTRIGEYSDMSDAQLNKKSKRLRRKSIRKRKSSRKKQKKIKKKLKKAQKLPARN